MSLGKGGGECVSPNLGGRGGCLAPDGQGSDLKFTQEVQPPLPHPTYQISDFSHRWHTLLSKIWGGRTLQVNFAKIEPATLMFLILVSKDGILYFQSKKTSYLLPLPSQRFKVVSVDLPIIPFFKTKAVSATCWVEGRGICRR
jgi:hypothetical protein